MKKLLFIIFLLASTFTLTGCWDLREINEIGLVMAVGVDKSEDGNGFLVTVQVAKPSEAAPKEGGGGGEPVWIGSAEGKTIFDAIRNIARFSSRRIMWAHNNIIIIGEDLAREGITPIVDFFTHNPELRMKTWVAVARGQASSYIGAKTGMENIPAISLALLFQYHKLPAKSIQSDMVDLFRDYKSEVTQPLLGVLNQTTLKGAGKTEVELSGSAVFKNGKLVGWLSGEETRGLAWIRKEIDNAIISVSCDGESEALIAAELKQIDVKTKSYVKGRKVAVDVTITALGNISEQDQPVDMTIDKFKANATKQLEEKVEEEISEAIKKLQEEFNSDAVFFGRTIHIQNKKEWYNWIKDDWEEIFPNITVNVKANIDVRSSTLYQIPMINEKKGEKVNNGSEDK